MKTAKYCLAAGGVLFLAAGYDRAESTNPWYLDVGTGAAITQNPSVRPSSLGSGGLPPMRLDTGIRGRIDLGYQMCPCWAVELETGVIWNSVNSIAGNPVDQGASADLYQVPMLAKLVYKPWHGKFQPYISAGCGGAASTIDMSNISNASQINIYEPSFGATDFGFAYQGEAGFKYKLSHNFDVGLAYEFMGTTDHNWSDHGLSLNTSGLLSHSIEVALTWHF